MTVTPVKADYRGKSEKDRLAIGEAMLCDRINGMRPSEMMEKYDVSHGTLYRRLDRAIMARVAPTVDRYREQMNAALDDTMVMIGQQMLAAERLITLGTEQRDAAIIERGMNQRSKAIDSRVRCIERRCKLMGLDAPVRAEVSVYVETEHDRELAEMISEAKAKAARARTSA